MIQITQVKEKFLAEIECLTEHRLLEVLDFAITHLKFKDVDLYASTFARGN